MKIRTMLACTLLILSLPVAAEFVTESLAYEVALEDINVPATPSSGVMFRKCADCEYTTLRPTPHTRYLVNGKPVELKEFRKVVFGIRNRAKTYLVVLHHLESDRVVSVSVTI